MVPPRGRMPRIVSRVSSCDCSGQMSPLNPLVTPMTRQPYSSLAVRTAARMTAFNPGQSPPPLQTPMVRVEVFMDCEGPRCNERFYTNIRTHQEKPSRGCFLPPAGGAICAFCYNAGRICGIRIFSAGRKPDAQSRETEALGAAAVARGHGNHIHLPRLSEIIRAHPRDHADVRALGLPGLLRLHCGRGGILWRNHTDSRALHAHQRAADCGRDVDCVLARAHAERAADGSE